MKQILSLFYFADKETEEYKDGSVTQGPIAVRVLCSEAHPASAEHMDRLLILLLKGRHV